MNRREFERLDRELSGLIDSMVADMGRPERRRTMKWYLVGLLLDGERKSIEPVPQPHRGRLSRCPHRR
jgi:hypothetical protein